MVAIKPPALPFPPRTRAPGSAQDLAGKQRSRRLFKCIVASLILHEIVVALLAWLVVTPWYRQGSKPPIELAAVEPQADVEVVTLPEVTVEDPVGLALVPDVQTTESTLIEAPQISAPQVGFSGNPPTPRQENSTALVAPQIDLPAATAPPGGGLEGRQADARAKLVAERGGSPQSEAAVERGLAWLAAHQHADGGWRFDLSGGPCDGRCRHSGHEQSTTAATGLALLPFLGAGQSPLEGEHGSAVAKGLLYLRSRMIDSPRGGDLQEGSMYGQGLAAIALSEAAAMTGDEELKVAAQSALAFIVRAQHVRGGWRYFPGQPGDITVVGWQWMALKSGHMAGINVAPETLTRAGEFLDGVQTDDGAAYGYQRPDTKASPTAIGLLCRMYSGWQRNDPRLARGVERLAEAGPSYEDMYYNYYAAQVLNHYDGPQWPAWNERLRNHLVITQSERDHEVGSWQFNDLHTAPGGRLCDTALAVMILEVYYRYLPLYGWRSVEF